MGEYTYDNVIIDPHKEGVRSLIGKEVYFEAKPFLCLKAANEKLASNLGILVEVYKDSINPFCVKGKSGSYKYPCIIEKKEESKPEYVPFKSMEEFVEGYVEAKGGVKTDSFEDRLLQCGMWIKVKGISSGGYCTVNELWNDGVALGHSKIYNVQNASGEFSTVIETVSWEDLYKGFTFLDGSPCGKLVEIK